VGLVNKVMILEAAVAGEREFYRVADVLKEIPFFVLYISYFTQTLCLCLLLTAVLSGSFFLHM